MSRTAPAPSRSVHPRRWTALAVTLLLALAAAGALPGGGGTAVAAPAAATVTWTDDFDGSGLDARWQVVNAAPEHLAVSDGALRIAGQPGDTYQTTNTAKNIVMVDVPAGDFTATATLSAPVTKVFQGAGIIAWKDMDNYVRSGLTFVGGLSPSGIAIENDAETGGAFSAVTFTDRPGATGATLKVQRTGTTIATSVYDTATSSWLPAGSTTVSFDTTQVGLYALAAQDGTVLPAAFDSFTIEHEPGVDRVPATPFVLQATGDAPFLVTDGDAIALTADQPTASLRFVAENLGDGALALTSEGSPVVLSDGALTVGGSGDEASPLRITDAGGGKVVLRDAGDPTAYVTEAADGHLALGAEADAVRFLLSEVAEGGATLDIDGDGKGASISDSMFGIFYEDINYAADGGLYAELVRNRSFEFNSSDNGSFTGMTAWSALDRSGSGTTANVVNDAGRLNEMNRNYLTLNAAAAGDGIRNAGFNNGFALATGKTYEASVWAKSATAQDLRLRVEDTAGTGVLATGTVALEGTNTWKKYDVELTATGTTDAGRFAVLAGTPSTVALDMVSLMPQDTWVGPVNGRSVFRKDLAEKVAAMNPGFLRFPGGCVTNVGTFKTYEESGYSDRRRTYQWKETIGPVEERPANWNFWGYNQSYGIGYLEYFELAEDLGAEPLPVVSVGANGCGGAGIPEMHDPALIDRWVDDTVDLIEFANGGTDTEWGARRAALGHPEPFGLDMIGLGNEENTTTFEANFPEFRDAIKAKYPDIKIISNSGPDSSGARFDTLWNYNRAQEVDLVDEHYYRDPSWFLENNHRYDTYDRTGPKVFLGEYASRGNTMYNALSEASYMTALQRNADIVRLASYAPLLSNESHVQWSPDAIWFDNDESWETPNWEVQKLFGNNVGDEVAPSTFDGPVNAPEDIGGGVFLSTWSTSAAYDNVTVTSNDTGATLFSDQFGDGTQWSPQTGSWAASGGRYVQSSTSVNDARSIISGAYTKDWTNYTLELDATKLSGAEGFLIGFGAKATNDYYWWNLGGWNNTRSVLQRANGGSANEVKALEGTGVTTGQTYRVKVVVDGTNIKLYLDGELQMSYDQPQASEKVFQVVTRDRRTGDLVAKVVNTSTSPVRTDVNVSDVEVAPTATVTTLAGAPSAVNTKADKDRVKPVTRQVAGISDSFTYEFPASSVTFLRMETVDNAAPVVGDLTVSGTEANGWYADPATVSATATDDREVDHLESSIDGADWVRHDGDSASVQVSGNGLHTVEWRAVDAQGNIGEARPVVVGIDAEAPVTAADLDAGARTVILSAADSGSGVASTEYRLGDGVWTTYDAPVAVGDDATTVAFRSTDELGNVEDAGTLAVPADGTTLADSVTAAVVADDDVRYGEKVRVDVAVSAKDGTPTGTVDLLEGDRLVATGQLASGRVRFSVPASTLGVGRHDLVARYAGNPTYTPSEDAVRVTVRKASSKTRASFKDATVRPSQRGKALVTVTAAGTRPTGTVLLTIRRDGRTVGTRTVSLAGGDASVALPQLGLGSYRVTATYHGSPTVGTSSDVTTLRVTRSGR